MTIFETLLTGYVALSFVYLILVSFYRIDKLNSWRDIEIWEILLAIVFLPIVIACLLSCVIFVILGACAVWVVNKLKLYRRLGDIFKKTK